VSLALVFVLAFALLEEGVTPAYGRQQRLHSGSVTDPQELWLLCISHCSDKDTNQSTTAESDSSGLFRMAAPPGPTGVEVTKQGFRKIVFEMLMFP